MFAKSCLSRLARASVIVRTLKSPKGAEIYSGHVKFYDTGKGFGFIAPDNGQPDCFVHQSGICADGYRSLAAGELVEFEVEVDKRGPGSRTAINVTGPDGVRVKGIPRPPTRPRM